MNHSKKIEVRDARKGKSIFAIRNLERDELIFVFEGEILTHPDRNSLQIGERRHLHEPGAIHESLNHSCEPNAYVDFDRLHLKALRPIAAGEEVTLNYMTAEAEMFNSFRCQCRSRNCYGQIRGFRHLTPDQQVKLEPFLSAWLLEELRRQDQNEPRQPATSTGA